MTFLLDTSLWIDFTPTRRPASLKQFIASYVLDPEAHLAEPVRIGVLRSARSEEARLLEAQFATLPCQATPAHLWQRAIDLGQACRPWRSCPFRCPAPLARLVIGPGGAAAGEVRTVGDQAPVQLAGE